MSRVLTKSEFQNLVNGFLFNFFEVFPETQPYHIVDVGARLTNESPAYQSLLKCPGSRITAFEADAQACLELESRMNPPNVVSHAAIGDGRVHTLHSTAQADSSSLFPPNPQITNRLYGLAELLEAKKSESIETSRLDDLLLNDTVDYIKADIQGAELLMLQGASKTLTNVLCLDVEVSFIEFYKGQPLFSDIEKYLREANFQFNQFMEMKRRLWSPLKPLKREEGRIQKAYGQCAWSDAFFFRSPANFDDLSDDQILKMAGAVHSQFLPNRLIPVDLVTMILSILAERGKPEFSARYLEATGLNKVLD